MFFRRELQRDRDRGTETEGQSEVALTPGVSPRRAHSLPQTRTPANTPPQPLPPLPEAIPLWRSSRPSGDGRGGRQGRGRSEWEDLKSPQRGKEGRRRSVMVAWQWERGGWCQEELGLLVPGSWFLRPPNLRAEIKDGFRVCFSQSHVQTAMTL